MRHIDEQKHGQMVDIQQKTIRYIANAMICVYLRAFVKFWQTLAFLGEVRLTLKETLHHVT